ncbi:hypothetical protein SAMN02910298_01394 [Pseudobutyrivibrio sp. YE44]|uniref:hypothetical protein n=1 Tax=Pseudobutyrivibrio sp. YE44 TaxID=1520802 RepID=UPI00088A24E7|nr:hypothetical protein [Pseudobutyrivibrio sp. YE44]SDB28742.1 hypothetical protein SAMN02910298_01394 [Pseudobutyrivibrio sp. YE44]
MKGKHRIIIETEKLKYEFTIKRNITIIQGDSATGKTTLIDLLRLYSQFKDDSGIMLQSDVPCVVYSGDSQSWNIILETYKNSIVFFDEDYSFIYTKEFADKIQNTSNYYVLITRQPLYNIPYSIQEIYGIRTTGKYHYPDKIYHEFYNIYMEKQIEPEKDVIVMVEDSKSGYQFYSSVFGNNRCISVDGNS